MIEFNKDRNYVAVHLSTVGRNRFMSYRQELKEEGDGLPRGRVEVKKQGLGVRKKGKGGKEEEDSIGSKKRQTKE